MTGQCPAGSSWTRDFVGDDASLRCSDSADRSETWANRAEPGVRLAINGYA